MIQNLHGHALERVTGTFSLFGVYAMGVFSNHDRGKMVGTLATATLVKVEDVTFLERVNKVMEIMYSVAQRTDLTVVGVAQHQFEPKGATGVLLLSESHFCIHTWPELQKCTVDVHTCTSDRGLPIRVITLLREEIGGIVKRLEVIDRL